MRSGVLLDILDLPGRAGRRCRCQSKEAGLILGQAITRLPAGCLCEVICTRLHEGAPPALSQSLADLPRRARIRGARSWELSPADLRGKSKEASMAASAAHALTGCGAAVDVGRPAIFSQPFLKI